MKHYDALVRVADILGWPRAYREDLLVHDKECCGMFPSTKPFAWSIRECGTHLIYVTCEDEMKWGLAVTKTSAGSGTDHKLFIWNGKKLEGVDAKAWDKFLKDQYNALPAWAFRVTWKFCWSQRTGTREVVRADTEDRALEVLKSRLNRGVGWQQGANEFVIEGKAYREPSNA